MDTNGRKTKEAQTGSYRRYRRWEKMENAREELRWKEIEVKGELSEGRGGGGGGVGKRKKQQQWFTNVLSQSQWPVLEIKDSDWKRVKTACCCCKCKNWTRPLREHLAQSVTCQRKTHKTRMIIIPLINESWDQNDQLSRSLTKQDNCANPHEVMIRVMNGHEEMYCSNKKQRNVRTRGRNDILTSCWIKARCLEKKRERGKLQWHKSWRWMETWKIWRYEQKQVGVRKGSGKTQGGEGGGGQGVKRVGG